MTSNLKDLIDSSFYLMYHMNISPSEVDNLSTYEMREYITLLNERRRVENEEQNSMTSAFSRLFLGNRSRNR